jgi:hypothetical protein
MPSCSMLQSCKSTSSSPASTNETLVDGTITRENYGIALPIGSALRKKINETLLDITADGTYDELLQVFRGRELRLKSSRPPRRAGASTQVAMPHLRWHRTVRVNGGGGPDQTADAPDTLNKWATSGSDNPRAAAPPIGHSEPSAGRTSRNPPPAGRCPTGSPAGSERRTAGDA